MLNGDRSISSLGITAAELEEIFHTEEFVGDVGEFCAPVSTVDDNVLDGYSCSAGHTLAYISPFGDVFPCVQFPMPCGSVRKQSFREIWYKSEALTELRAVHVRDLPHLLALQPHRLLLPLPGLGLYGRRFSRAILAGLREVVRPHRNPFCRSIASRESFLLKVERPCPDRRSQSSRVVIDFSLCRGIVRRSGRGKRV